MGNEAVTVSDTLPPDLIHALVSAEPRLAGFARLRYFAEVDSTNDIALALCNAGAPEGTSVLADVQHAGRGRRGRTWFSPPGAGLYLSVVVRMGESARTLPLLTLAAGVAAADAVAATSGLPLELKWPNDLVIGRPWRKLGGLLCEAVGAGSERRRGRRRDRHQPAARGVSRGDRGPRDVDRDRAWPVHRPRGARRRGARAPARRARTAARRRVRLGLSGVAAMGPRGTRRRERALVRAGRGAPRPRARHR